MFDHWKDLEHYQNFGFYYSENLVSKITLAWTHQKYYFIWIHDLILKSLFLFTYP